MIVEDDIRMLVMAGNAGHVARAVRDCHPGDRVIDVVLAVGHLAR